MTTPNQYRRECAKAMRAAAADLIEDECSFMSQHGMAQAIRAIDVDAVLAGLPTATSILDMISAEEWQNIDATQDDICVQAERPCTDCGQTHDTGGDLCPTCVCVRAEIAAMGADRD